MHGISLSTVCYTTVMLVMLPLYAAVRSTCTDGRSRSALSCCFWRFIGVASVEGGELPGHCYLCTTGLITEAPAAQEQTDPSNHARNHTISVHIAVHNLYFGPGT